MRLDQVCGKKDRRLLVLLALSPFILFSDITFFTGHKPTAYNSSWMEIIGNESLTYRYELTDDPVDFIRKGLLIDNDHVTTQTITTINNSLKQGRVVALEEEQGKYKVVRQFSPRLAFFLGQPFSINTAHIEDFTLIHGVGTVLASNIIAYREIHGPITDSSQLENIPGIGPRTKQKLEKYFTYRVDGE